MTIDHEAHKIRVKAVSDKMNHPMTYNDAGAPKLDQNDPEIQNMQREIHERTARVLEARDKKSKAKGAKK